MNDSSREYVHLTVTLPSNSVMIPAWALLLIIACFVVASIGLLLVWDTNRQESREIRSLQLHVQDVENVLIRSGLAHRSDMASWTEPDEPPKPKTRKER